MEQNGFQEDVCCVCLKRKVKLPLKKKLPCMFLAVFFFATVEINYFVPFGFGNLKTGTHGSSHSPVTGGEGGEVGERLL